MWRAEVHRSQGTRGAGHQLVTHGLEHRRVDDLDRQLPAVRHTGERGRFRGHSDDVQQADCTTRCRPCSERFELIGVGLVDADDRCDPGPRQPTHRISEQGEEHVAAACLCGDPAHVHDEACAPFLVQVQTRRRHLAADRGADVDEIAVAVRAGAEDAVGEHDRVRFGPGDLFAEHRGVDQLVWSARPRRPAPHGHIGVHLAPGRPGSGRVTPIQLRVQQVESTDIESGGDPDAGALGSETFGEVQAHGSVVQTPVDVRPRDVEQAFGFHRLGETDDESHRSGDGRALLAFEEAALDRGEIDHRQSKSVPCGSGLTNRDSPDHGKESMNAQLRRWIVVGPQACSAALCRGPGYPLLFSKL